MVNEVRIFRLKVRSTNLKVRAPRSDLFEEGDDLPRFGHVPDIDAEADDPGVMFKDTLNDLASGLGRLKLDDPGLRLKRAHVRVQITQSHRGVDELGI